MIFLSMETLTFRNLFNWCFVTSGLNKSINQCSINISMYVELLASTVLTEAQMKMKSMSMSNVNIWFIFWIYFCILIPSSYFIIIQLLTSQICIIRAVWIYVGKTRALLALVHKKNLFNTSRNGPPKNTSPESFLVGTGALSSFTLLVFSTSQVSLCSLQCSLRHNTLSST